MIDSEALLAGLAYALIGGHDDLTPAERRLVLRPVEIPAKIVETTRKAIEAGDDPLGTRFCILRSAAQRRECGATYTPPPIVASMVAWATRQPAPPVRVVDPGSGSGRYLVAAARVFPAADLVAVETDPLALLLLRANAHVCGFHSRLTVHAHDYRDLALPDVEGRTLFIGNPPYVRHHQIPDHRKAWFAETAARYGFRASKLAGLHIHFFLKTRELSRPGDYGTYITAAEWIDVNYGSILREMLADGLDGASLHVIDPAARPFADAMTTGAITCFTVGAKPDHLTVNAVTSLDELADLSGGSKVEWPKLENGARWSIHVRKTPKPVAGDMELGELFHVHRGQVTGANAIWIAGPSAAGLPKRFLLPSVTKARELLSAGDSLKDPEALRQVIDLPTDLGELAVSERASVDAFLARARLFGTHQGYVARHRKAWWSVGLKNPAPILCTYMARRAPAFVRNLCNARHINIAHGLYPRGPMDDALLDRILRYLKGNVSMNAGRIYAGGLAKFEPREVERLPLPSFDRLREMTI